MMSGVSNSKASGTDLSRSRKLFPGDKFRMRYMLLDVPKLIHPQSKQLVQISLNKKTPKLP